MKIKVFYGFQSLSYTCHFVQFWSFRTHFFTFSHFVPNWSFLTQFGHFVPTCTLIFSFKSFVHFVPTFNIFVPKPFRTKSHVVPSLTISYPCHFVSGYEITWIRIDLLFDPNTVRNDMGTSSIMKTRPCNIQQYFMAVKMFIFR